MGSTGPVLPSGIDSVLAGDKSGSLISLNPDSLGHIDSSAGADVFTATPAGIFNFALWQTAQGTLLYEHDINGCPKSYEVTSTAIIPTPA